MKRQLILFAYLTAAVAVAVLLRTASPDAGDATVQALDPVEPRQTSVAEIEDCSIAAKPAPQLASSDAAQPIPVTQLAVADMAVALTADARASSAAPTSATDVPRPQYESVRVTIRPPPAPFAT